MLLLQLLQEISRRLESLCDQAEVHVQSCWNLASRPTLLSDFRAEHACLIISASSSAFGILLFGLVKLVYLLHHMSTNNKSACDPAPPSFRLCFAEESAGIHCASLARSPCSQKRQAGLPRSLREAQQKHTRGSRTTQTQQRPFILSRQTQ